MTTELSLLITFDPDTWTPADIYPNAKTDKEEARLKEIADQMIAAIKENGK